MDDLIKSATGRKSVVIIPVGKPTGNLIEMVIGLCDQKVAEMVALLPPLEPDGCGTRVVVALTGLTDEERCSVILKILSKAQDPIDFQPEVREN